MTEPTALMPCPFCGAAGQLDFQDGSTHRWGVAYCAECGASAGETRREYPDVGEWHAKAVAQWNTRTPPTQAQAGAVPLTDEQIKEVMDLVSDWGMQSHLRGEAELDAHNPEATEDEITYAKECAEKERAAWNAIKDKLQAHGIKGGQHGAE